MKQLVPFIASVRKEVLLLLRDRHGLLLMFAMPAVFVLIMSLALQGEFSARAGKQIQVLFVDRDHSAAAATLRQRLSASSAFALQPVAAIPADIRALDLSRGGYAFAVEIEPGYEKMLGGEQEAAAAAMVNIWVAADTSKQTEQIFAAVLRESVARQRIDALLARLRETAPEMQAFVEEFTRRDHVAIRYAYAAERAQQAPTAVQQNVPAWLVFGAFFIVIPLSNTLIRERQVGMLRRLRSMAVSWRTILASKWVTFFAINQLQLVVMFAVGVYLVPLLGGQALQINGSLLTLELMAIAVSVAALGYALLIAACCKTTEQATLLGGAGNIILAALGGVMVPQFVMPPTLQLLSNLSPMAWGLNGFLDVLLRGGGLQQIAIKMLALWIFGGVTFGAAYYVLQKPNE